MDLNDLCILYQIFWHACHGLHWVDQSKKNLFTTKSKEFKSVFLNGQASRPYKH